MPPRIGEPCAFLGWRFCAVCVNSRSAFAFGIGLRLALPEAAFFMGWPFPEREAGQYGPEAFANATPVFFPLGVVRKYYAFSLLFPCFRLDVFRVSSILDACSVKRETQCQFRLITVSK